MKTQQPGRGEPGNGSPASGCGEGPGGLRGAAGGGVGTGALCRWGTRAAGAAAAADRGLVARLPCPAGRGHFARRRRAELPPPEHRPPAAGKPQEQLRGAQGGECTLPGERDPVAGHSREAALPAVGEPAASKGMIHWVLWGRPSCIRAPSLTVWGGNSAAAS